jgi:predicted transcriptional regulator
MADTTDLLPKSAKVTDVVELDLEDTHVLTIMKALSSKTRREILQSIKYHLDVCQTAKRLKQTEANISAQIKILEKAQLVNPKYEAGRHGVRKFCNLAMNQIVINI